MLQQSPPVQRRIRQHRCASEYYQIYSCYFRRKSRNQYYYFEVEEAESDDMERQNYQGTRKRSYHAGHKMSGDSRGRKRKSEEKTQMHSYVVLIISTAWLHDAASCLAMRAGCRPFLFRSVHKDKLLNPDVQHRCTFLDHQNLYKIIQMYHG